MSLEKNLMLAIETAIDGGSVSLWKGRTEIDFWIGTSEISKAEDVLEGIRTLLEKNKLRKENIGLVVVSNEAGSATGLKIGLATAQGLAKAFECRLITVSLWDALAAVIPSKVDEAATVFLPGGKNTIGSRDLMNRKFVSEIQIISREQFQTVLEVDSRRDFYAHRKVIQANTSAKIYLIKDLGKNLAGCIAKFASDNV